MVLIESQCLPPPAFFCEILQSPGVLIEQYENYQKRSFRNRIYILTSQGVKLLTIPLVKGKNEQLPIKDVCISYDTDWPDYFDRVITSCYSNAPFFQFYKEPLCDHFYRRPEKLFTLNTDLLKWAFSCMGISTVIEYTTGYSEKYPAEINDLRNKFSPRSGNLASKDLLKYEHVFEISDEDIPELSIIDLLFCRGPESLFLLKRAI